MKLQDFKRKKACNEKISIITCYDYPSARLVAESNLDCVLVGDSVAMVVHGHEHTVMATMDMMVMHTAAVARGLTNQFLISDLPFLCHRKSQADTIDNVKRLLTAGAQAVKIEGGDDDTCRTIEYLVTAGIPVMGHIGLTPQSVLQLGGYHIQGKNQEQANQLEKQAKKLASAGCFALVIECVPKELAAILTKNIDIPTIGIGAGSDTDGQVLVWHDLLGLHTDMQPRFVKRFANAKETLFAGIQAYAAEVHQVAFPAVEHTFYVYIMLQLNITTWQQTRLQLQPNASIGFVPTMGNLHKGHATLFAQSLRENDYTIASIFVNPKQFNNQDDFIHYPRTLEADLKLLYELGVTHCLVPTTDELYKDNYRYILDETQHSKLLEGEHRPGHFTGVLTIVMKLLQLVKPQRAYFGEKDYQQLQLIRGMVDAFFIPVEIIACPIIREASGLACSSRNNRLSTAERAFADRFAAIFHQQDKTDSELIQELQQENIRVEYLITQNQHRFVAVQIGAVRLIDNYPLCLS